MRQERADRERPVDVAAISGLCRRGARCLARAVVVVVTAARREGDGQCAHDGDQREPLTFLRASLRTGFPHTFLTPGFPVPSDAITAETYRHPRADWTSGLDSRAREPTESFRAPALPRRQAPPGRLRPRPPRYRRGGGRRGRGAARVRAVPDLRAGHARRGAEPSLPPARGRSFRAIETADD